MSKTTKSTLKKYFPVSGKRLTENHASTERFLQHLRKFAIFSLVILPTISCLEQNSSLTDSEKAAEFEQLLTKGRGVRLNKTSPTTAFGLFVNDADSNIVEIRRDDLTGAATYISYKPEKMPEISAQDLIAYSLKVIKEQPYFFKVPFQSLEIMQEKGRTQPNHMLILSFKRNINGLEVRDAYIDFAFRKTNPVSEVWTTARSTSSHPATKYKLYDVTNRTGGHFTVKNIDADSITFENLLKKIGGKKLDLISSKEYILKVQTDDKNKYVKATEFLTTDPITDERFTISIEAGSGIIHEAFPHRMHLTKPHQFMGTVLKNTYIDPTTLNYPLAFARVSDRNANNVLALDADGTGDVGTLLTESVNITLSSPRVKVIDFSRLGSAVIVPTNGFDAAGKTMIPGSDLQSVAVNIYAAVNRINRFARRHYKQTDTSILSTQMPVYVNKDKTRNSSGQQVAFVCNAYYRFSGSISMAKQGTIGTTSCANMSLVTDVLYHEWGHGLDNKTGRQIGITDSAFSEGIGDIVASYYTGNPILGSGFYTDNPLGIRTAKNNAKYPDDDPGRGAARQPHFEGRIISGAFWDLREALISKYGAAAGAYKAEQLFFNHLLIAITYLESYDIVRRLDDDDGNPATPTPNACLINAAFAKHGLAQITPGCTEIAGSDLPFSEDLFLSMRPSTAGEKIIFQASGPLDTPRIDLCFGHWSICEKGNKIDIRLNRVGSLGERELFIAPASSTLPREQFQATLFAKDPYGKVVGVRTVKFTLK